MRICYFGMYAPNYSRNHILIKGFRQNGVDVVECNDRSHLLWGLRYFKLLRKFVDSKGWTCDIFFVGFPGQTDVPLAWMLGKIFHKKVIFDAFISLYNSMVFDRKYFSQKNWRAKAWWLVDWASCFLADLVVLDTNEHIKYFVKTFGIKKDKFIRVFVGTDTEIFYPRRKKPQKNFIVGFHGSFLPLQGVPVIIRAAKLLPEITFRLLGEGLEYSRCRKLAEDLKVKNVEFLKQVKYERLADFISESDIYLGGPFGNNIKAKLVIPNKVYESMACRKAVIVGDSPAIRELFSHEINCIIVKQNSPIELARAILMLKKNRLVREKIAGEGFSLIQRRLGPKDIAFLVATAII